MEITKELEALAKYQNSGAPIIFADCQIVFGDNATLFGDILKKDTAHASTTQDPQGVDPKFKTEKAKTIFKKLVENGYTHTEGSSYVWDVSQAEYGYMVYIVSDLLNIKHPSSNRILWMEFRAIFSNAESMESSAKVAVSKSVSCYESYKSWPNGAKKIRNILLQ